MKARGYIAILFIMLISSTTWGQTKKRNGTMDFGIFLGAANYMGELTEGMVPPINRTGPSIGLLTRIEINPFWNFKASAIYGRISGSDKDYDDDAFRRARNLHFRSNVFDVHAGLEWNILSYQSTRGTNAFSPYLFGGLGVFKYNPKAKFVYNDGVIPGTGEFIHHPSTANSDGDWIELQPLGTEGQETKQFNDREYYSLTQISIPFGFGFKAQLDQHWTIGMEMGFRKTFTDYIDDISKDYVDYQIVTGAHGYLANEMRDRSAEVGEPEFEDGDINGAGVARGNDKTKDWYVLTGITITYRILGAKDKCFQF